MKSSQLVVFSLSSFALIVTGCQSSPTRMPSSTSVTQQSVAPIPYELAPSWKVALHKGEKNNWAVGKLSLVTYKLGTPEGLKDFENRLREIKGEDKDAREAALDQESKVPAVNGKGKHKHNHKKAQGFLDKSSKLCVKLMLELVEKAKTPNISVRERNDALQEISEIAATFNYNYTYPIRSEYWIAEVPFAILSALHHGTMTDEAQPSIDVVAPTPNADLSLVDPAPSSFWHSPGDISRENLYYGFNRSEIPHVEGICQYDGAKTSYGTHGGFKMVCGSEKLRIKFGDKAKKEPFLSRITWALGFNATPIDYANGIKVAYDRRLFTDFNVRKSLDIKLKSLFGFDYGKIHMQKYREPFEVAIASAVLKNGQKLSSKELRSRILKSSAERAEQLASNFDPKVEDSIDYLVLNEGNIELETSKDKTLGEWSWNGLDHPDRRAFRGFGIYSGYLNMFDARLNNNRLRVRISDDGTHELLHYVSDVGSGLGKGSSVLAPENGLANQFGWDYMRVNPDAQNVTSDGRPVPTMGAIEIIEFSPLEANKTFEHAQIDDAKWMARKLSQITEDQFQDALIASGYDATEVRIYLEKFLSRRNSMIKALQLDKELPEPRQFHRDLDYDPTKDALPVAKGSSARVVAPIGESKIVRGKLVPRTP